MIPTKICWHPREDDLANSHVARLMRTHGIATTAELRERAATDPAWFYPAMIEDLGITFDEPYSRLIDDSGGFPWTRWFLGGRLNIVRNVLDRHLEAGHGEQPAVIAEADDGAVTRLSYSQLDERVCRLAAALAGLAIGPGDAVGFYLPMTAEVVVALLACLKIGAVPVPVFAGFGPDALAARLADCGARILLTADATERKGKLVKLKSAADRAAELSGCVEKLIVLRATGCEIAWNQERDLWWHDIEAAAPVSWPTASLPSDARSLLLYTSGTTGKPKGVIHTHAGVQMVVAKEVGYHADLRPGEVMFWLTDIGWMMGPWEILGVLFHRGTVVLMNGAPDYPDTDRVWRMVEDHKVTHLALAPTAVRLLATHGEEAAAAHDLSTVRILASTGEPWDGVSYDWYFRVAGGGRCPVINISGGTELMGCLLAPLVTEALKPCSLQGSALGMDIDVFDEEGASLRGEKGYLVCKHPAPNMTRGFLGERERYLSAYFEQFGNTVWAHGDWAIVDEDGFWFLTGRADDTLKIAGKRIGPGEVEAAAISHPALREAAAIGLADELKGTRLVLVAVANAGFEQSDKTAQEVRTHIAKQMGSAMRPAELHWADALPVTRSGKILRGVIKRVLSGEPAGDLSSAANPDAVDSLRR